MDQEDGLIQTDVTNIEYGYPAMPPSYEECLPKAAEPKADHVASPLAMAAMLVWEEEED